MTPIKVVQPAYEDPENSVDLFDASRKNDELEMYCVAAAIHPNQVEDYWQDYIQELNDCKHWVRIGDNCGESCRECGKQLSGYGYGGFFGNRLTGTTTCIHLFAPMENDSICIYCEEWKSNLEGGDS